MTRRRAVRRRPPAAVLWCRSLEPASRPPPPSPSVWIVPHPPAAIASALTTGGPIPVHCPIPTLDRPWMGVVEDGSLAPRRTAVAVLAVVSVLGKDQKG